MQNIRIASTILFLSLALNGSALAGDTHSGQAVTEASKAGSHASQSAAHAIVGSGQVVSAASAVPLAIGGSAGAVSTEIAKDLMNAATAPAGTPLEITDENITAGPPPDQALKIKAQTNDSSKKAI